MKILHIIAFILAMVGGLTWGLVGLGMLANFNGNIVNMLFGSWPMAEAVVYVVVGLSALYLLVMHKKECTSCGTTPAGV